MATFKAPGLRNVSDLVPDCCQKCEFGNDYFCKNPKNWEKDDWEKEHNLPAHFSAPQPGRERTSDFDVCDNYEEEKD